MDSCNNSVPAVSTCPRILMSKLSREIHWESFGFLLELWFDLWNENSSEKYKLV